MNNIYSCKLTTSKYLFPLRKPTRLIKYSSSKCKQALSVCNDIWKAKKRSQKEADSVFQKAAYISFTKNKHSRLISRLAAQVLWILFQSLLLLVGSFLLQQGSNKWDLFVNCYHKGEKNGGRAAASSMQFFLFTRQLHHVLFPWPALGSTVPIHPFLFAGSLLHPTAHLHTFCFFAPATHVSIKSSWFCHSSYSNLTAYSSGQWFGCFNFYFPHIYIAKQVRIRITPWPFSLDTSPAQRTVIPFSTTHLVSCRTSWLAAEPKALRLEALPLRAQAQ